MTDRSGPVPDGKDLVSSLLKQQQGGSSASEAAESAPGWRPPAIRGAEKRDYTLGELQQFDGCVPEASIFVAVKRNIYDVTSRPDLYGTGGAYSYLPGKDASRLLAKMKPKLEEGEDPLDLSDLTEKEQATLDQWDAFFAKKYEVVGKVIVSDVGAR